MTGTIDEEMVIDAVDHADRELGVLRRRDVFLRHANFRVAHIFIFDNSGSLLLQKIARRRKRHPGYWGSSVAAYLFSGESYAQAAQRRLTQELGIQTPLRFFGKTSMNDEGCQKFIGLFTGVYDGIVGHDPSEIEALDYLSIDEILRMKEIKARLFTPTFLHLIDFYLART